MKLPIRLAVLGTAFGAFAPLAFADTMLTNYLGSGTSLSSLLTTILGFVTQIGSIIIILIVYIGFLFVTARGEPGKITAAKEALMWTVVGALILLGAQAISLGIQATVTSLSNGG